jgi:hypothetical protein
VGRELNVKKLRAIVLNQEIAVGSVPAVHSVKRCKEIRKGRQRETHKHKRTEERQKEKGHKTCYRL